MGTVYLAEHQRLKRKCAIKLLPRERVSESGWLERFDREMTTIASLQHDHIVRATDAGHQDGWHYLVMEYLDGLDVGRVASRIGRLEQADACEIIRQAALALAHVHKQGLVHRDVKPSNLMLTHDGNVKLLDLGLVLAGDDPLGVDDRLTTVGHLMGTMPYMAPEQLTDSRTVDHRSDIYALGSTFYRLLAGHTPHQRRRGLASQVLAITSEDAPTVQSLREDIDEEIDQLIAQMIDRDPSHRPQQMEEVASRLVPGGESSRLRRLLREAKRRREPDSTPPTPLMSLGQQFSNHEPPKKRWLQLAGAAGFGAFIIIAGLLIKIATDRGELVIDSQRDGVVVKVEQGDELVERLAIAADGDNRLVLRKGTYRVSIEGATDGIGLVDNVVVIHRGKETSLQIQNQSEIVSPGGPNTTEIGTDLDDAGMGEFGESEEDDDVGMVMELGGFDGLDEDYPEDYFESSYKGKTLKEWLKSLSEEHSVRSLSAAMQAVDRITKDAPPEVRLEACQKTLESARKWGGMTVAQRSTSETDDPSAVFMRQLCAEFPSYWKGPGIEVVKQEIAGGTRRSQVACLKLLHDFLHGEYSDAIDIPFESVKELIQSHNREDVIELRDSIVKLIQQINPSWPKKRDVPLNVTTEEDFIAWRGFESALMLQLMIESSVRDHQWLSASVQALLKITVEIVQQEEKTFQQWSSKIEKNEMVSPLPHESPPLGESVLYAAVQLSSESDYPPGAVKTEPTALAAGFEAADIAPARPAASDVGSHDVRSSPSQYLPPWNTMGRHIVHSTYRWDSQWSEQVFEQVAEHDSDALVERIHQRLLAFHESSPRSSVRSRTDYPNLKRGLPVFVLGDKSAFWDVALSYYARHATDAQEAATLLGALRRLMIEGGISKVVPGETFRRIDEAIRVLKDRGATEPTDAEIESLTKQSAHTVDPKMVTYAKRIIARYDKNKDQELTSSEWQLMLMSPASADSNRDGRVSVFEYAHWMQSRSKR